MGDSGIIGQLDCVEIVFRKLLMIRAVIERYQGLLFWVEHAFIFAFAYLTHQANALRSASWSDTRAHSVNRCEP
jgi:hypothetical protein